MDRSLLYKLAFFLALASLVPLVIFLSRRESPPEKVSVKLHNKQTVENFTLSSAGKEKWVLRAPIAVFEDRDKIKLEKPVLTVSSHPPAVIEAEEALFDRKSSRLYLKGVRLTSRNIKAFSPRGTYLLKRELFKGTDGCSFTLQSSNSTTTGKECEILVKERKVIISQGVKTQVFEVIR